MLPLLQEVGNQLEILLALINKAFKSLTYIGELLVLCLSCIGSCILSVTYSCLNGIIVVLNEFYFFLEDVGGLYEDVLHILTKGLNTCTDSLYAAVFSLFNIIQCCVAVLWALFDNCFFLLISIKVFVNSFLHIIGQSVIILFQAVSTFPCVLIRDINSVVGHIAACLSSFVIEICRIIFSVSFYLYQQVYSMPKTSVVGLLFVVASFVLGKVYFDQMVFSIRFAATNLRVAARESIKNTWRTTGQFLKKFFKKYVSLNSINKRVQLEENAQQTSEDLLRQLEMEREEKLCVVCRDRSRMIVLLPCRHYCLCQSCLDAILLRQAACPVCRHHVHDSWKVFT